MLERVETALGESRIGFVTGDNGGRPMLAVKKSKKRKVSPSLELIKGQFNKRLAMARNARVKIRLADRAMKTRNVIPVDTEPTFERGAGSKATLQVMSSRS